MSEPEIIRSTTLWMQMKGLLFFTFILLSTIINTIYVLIPLLPLMFINHNLWRRLMDYLIGLWLLVPCGLMEILFGVKITISGTKIDRTEPALIIMNHRTCLDWLFFWIALIQINPYLLVSQKISLKKIIRYIPGAGWAMATNAYLFLTRRFEKDQKHIENMIDYYANSKQPYQLLLYPEGTDKDSRAVERSRQFALKHDLVHYNYVLHPRTTGFTIMLRKMRQASYVKNIYDVTIGYADAIVQSEFELLFKGACPKNIHFCVNKIDVNSLPENDDEKISNWLKNRWQEKEAKLKQFYQSNDIQKRIFINDLNTDQVFKMTKEWTIVYVLIVILWSFVSLVQMYAFFHYPSHHILTVIAIITFVGSQILFDGFENIFIHLVKLQQNEIIK